MRGRSIELEQLEDAVSQIVSDLELYSYYQLLDLPPGGSGAVAEYNYNLKVYEYQKIQKDERCSAALFQALSLIVERMDEARQVLADPKLRAEYDQGLEEGNTRHPGVVAERAARRPAAEPPPDARKQAFELMAAKLERTIHKELLHAADAEVPDVSEGIEADLLDKEAQSLTGELAGYGVAIDVKEEAPEAAEAIDTEYLEKASLHLRREIYREAGSLTEAVEEEDQSAAANDQLVSDLTDQLHAELAELGVPENEEVEEEALPIDAETINRLAWQEQQAVLGLNVDTQVKADEELHARVVDQAHAKHISEELEAVLDRTGVDFSVKKKKPSAELPPAGETPIPIDLLAPLPAEPSAPVSLPRAVDLEPVLEPIPVDAAPARPTRRDPSQELERFDLVIPIDEEPPGDPRSRH